MKYLQLILILLIICVLAIGVCQAKEVITFSGVFSEGTAQVKVQYKFKELLEDRSQGEFQVNVITGSTLGGSRDHLEAAREGSLEMIAVGPEDMANFAPEYNFINIPFLIESREDFYDFWNGEVGKAVNKKSLELLNLRTLEILCRGSRYITSNKPIYSLADLKGLRIRMPQQQQWIRIFKDLGASPSPIAFNELYLALQTGIVEAQENPIVTIYAKKLFEVQEYLIATKHVFSPAKFQASEKWFSTLASESEELIIGCMKDAVKYGDDFAVEQEDKLMKDLLVNHNMKLIETPELELDSIRKAALDTIEKMIEEGLWNKELFNKIKDN